MATASSPGRSASYGQDRRLTLVDRLGVWLSARAVRRHVDLTDKRVGDFGSGYQATFMRTVLDRVEGAVLVDLALAPDLHRHPKVQALEGSLPGTLERLDGASLDVVLCISVLEHVGEPQSMLDHVHRLLAPGGVAVINVPSWRGKAFLEFSAFRLGLSPPEEMEDHKRYYDPRDLWPMVVRAGFAPSRIRCRRHKLGLNTLAVCRKPANQ
jgi:2-polyprenyl-3-methyl-5-hydroxy-6-metoxy-1,4-benzoquinol methylase